MPTIATYIDGQRYTATAATWPAAVKQLQTIIGARANGKSNEDDHAITRGSRDADGASEATATK